MNRRDLLILGSTSVAWPLAARAQQKAMPVIGYLALLPGEDATLMKLLVDRLHELGYREGQNLGVEYRSAEDRPERLPQLAAELVGLRPAVLIAGFGTLAATAAKAATATIPIVFTTVGDPIGAGLVASLARPGGNLTGLTDQAADLGGKRLELLREITPAKANFAVLLNPDTPYAALALNEIRGAAVTRQIGIEVLEARNADEVLQRLAGIGDPRAAGVLVLEDP